MENRRGIALMVLAMAMFAIEDTLIKLASADLPSGQVMMVLGLWGGLVFWGLARRAGVRVLDAGARHPAVVTRTFAEAVGTAAFVTALGLIPLSSASAILQSSPLLVTLGAVLVLGERVGPVRWAALAAGFLGVLMVVRPGAEVFTSGALLALLGASGLAVRDLASRRVPARIGTLQLSALAFSATVPVSMALMAVQGGPAVPGGGALLALAGACAISCIAYAAITIATRTGDISAVMPFRYSRLVFGTALGALVFGEQPDGPTLAGAALILVAGVVVLLRERRMRGPAAGPIAPTTPISPVPKETAP